MQPLAGAVALVTGASSGIGYAAALSLARRGVHIAATARREDRLRELAAAIAGETGGAQTLVLPADLTAPGEPERVARAAEAWQGRVDILVNNAGFGRMRPLPDLDPAADIIPQLNLDLQAPILLARALLPGMLARRSGVIINVDSVAGLVAIPPFSIYSAAKYGLRGFNDALRREVQAGGVKVCLLCPGPVRTEFAEHTGRRRGPEDRLSDRTAASAEQVGELIAGLARRPRRMAVIPWYYRLPVFLADMFPGLIDILLNRFYVPSLRKR
jgi:short-subunit dehydrogenase